MSEIANNCNSPYYYRGGDGAANQLVLNLSAESKSCFVWHYWNRLVHDFRAPYVIGKVSALASVSSCKWFGVRAYCFTCFKRLLNSSIKAVLVNIGSVITRYILIHCQKPPNWTSIPVKEQSTSCIAKILLSFAKKKPN